MEILLVILAVLVVALAGVAVQVRLLLEVADAHTAIVAYGPPSAPAGELRGVRVVIGPGRLLRVPLLERVERLDLRPMSLGLTLDPVETADGHAVSLRVEARAWISHREPLIHLAIGNFLGAARDRVARAAVEVAEATVRRTLAGVASRDLARDLEAIEAELADAVGRELEALGLELGELTVASATDRAGVLHGLRQAR